MNYALQRRISDGLIGVVFGMVFAAQTQGADLTFQVTCFVLAVANLIWGMALTRHERASSRRG